MFFIDYFYLLFIYSLFIYLLFIDYLYLFYLFVLEIIFGGTPTGRIWAPTWWIFEPRWLDLGCVLLVYQRMHKS